MPDKDTGSNIAHTLLTLTEEFERGMEQVLPSEVLPSKVLPSKVLPAGEIPCGEGTGVPEAAGAPKRKPSPTCGFSWRNLRARDYARIPRGTR